MQETSRKMVAFLEENADLRELVDNRFNSLKYELTNLGSRMNVVEGRVDDLEDKMDHMSVTPMSAGTTPACMYRLYCITVILQTK